MPFRFPLQDTEVTGIQESIGSALAFLSLVATGFTVAAALALDRKTHPAGAKKRDAIPVTLLKPLHLAEAGLEENLKSFIQQDYDGPIQIVFGATSPDDSALHIANALRRDFPRTDVRIVVEPSRVGKNPKVANLVNMAAHAKHELLIMSDSDIRVTPDYVRRIVAAIEEPGVGAVSCLYSGKALGNVWSKLAAMNIDCHFLPNARLGLALGLARPCFGSTIAFRRQTLDEIGGFACLADVLADDYELGRAIRARGYRISIPDHFTVEHVCSQTSAPALLRQELRWARTNLVLAPIGYAGTIVTYPLPVALLAILFQGLTMVSAGVLVAALASRLYLMFKSAKQLGWHPEYVLLLPLRDVLSFFVYLASFFGRTVEWRGRRFATGSNGALAPIYEV
jgi:ceramide glucosyltransferase